MEKKLCKVSCCNIQSENSWCGNVYWKFIFSLTRFTLKTQSGLSCDPRQHGCSAYISGWISTATSSSTDETYYTLVGGYSTAIDGYQWTARITLKVYFEFVYVDVMYIVKRKYKIMNWDENYYLLWLITI